MGAFDPSAMHVTRLAEADMGESVADTTAQISLIADGEVRQRCASAKLAAQIVSRVYHVSSDLAEGEILGGMTEVLKRLAAVRQVCLSLAGVNQDHPDYGAAFAMCTAVALETVTEEFKWRQIGGRTKELPMALFGRLIDAVSAKQPRLFPKSTGHMDLSAARKLATLHAMPVMMGLVNLFDFYAMDTEAMACRLVYAVAAQAEYHALQGVEGMSDLGQALMIQRAYGVSVDVMAQVYNACARKAVEQLQDMQEIDRAFAIGNFERIGGMPYEHVLEEHDRVMRKTYEVCDLIVVAQSAREGRNGA